MDRLRSLDPKTLTALGITAFGIGAAAYHPEVTSAADSTCETEGKITVTGGRIVEVFYLDPANNNREVKRQVINGNGSVKLPTVPSTGLSNGKDSKLWDARTTEAPNTPGLFPYICDGVTDHPIQTASQVTATIEARRTSTPIVRVTSTPGEVKVTITPTPTKTTTEVPPNQPWPNFTDMLVDTIKNNPKKTALAGGLVLLLAGWQRRRIPFHDEMADGMERWGNHNRRVAQERAKNRAIRDAQREVDAARAAWETPGGAFSAIQTAEGNTRTATTQLRNAHNDLQNRPEYPGISRRLQIAEGDLQRAINEYNDANNEGGINFLGINLKDSDREKARKELNRAEAARDEAQASLEALTPEYTIFDTARTLLTAAQAEEAARRAAGEATAEKIRLNAAEAALAAARA